MPQEPGFTPVGGADAAEPGFTPVDSTTPSTTPKQAPFSPGTYQVRKGGPMLDPSKSALRTGIESAEGTFGIKDPTSVMDALKQFGTGAKQFAGKSWDELAPLQQTDPSGVSRALVFPFHTAARAAEGVASGISGGVQDIESGIQAGDSRSIASGVGSLLGTKVQMAAPEHVQRAFKTATSLIERQPTVEQGKIGYVNAARQAVDRLDNAVRNTGVGARAQSVIEADKLDNARTQSAGKVDTTEAVLAGQRMMDKTKMGAAPGGYPAQMSMDSAKALITQLGREASRMERTGKAPEAAAVWAEYDALRKATQDRAAELGGDHGKNWSDYITEHKNYMQLQNGLLGHITEGEHASALNKIIEHSGQMPELKKWFNKYHVDISPITDAAEQGKKLNELTQQSSNAVMGKIKLLSRHWALGLPALAGAHLGATALGLGGGIGGFILPLIIAGKVGGLLDKIQVKELLYDLKRKLPPEQFQVAGSPKGPMETLHNAASAPPTHETTGGWTPDFSDPSKEQWKWSGPGSPPPPGDTGTPQPTAPPEPVQPTPSAEAPPSPYTGPEQRVSPAGGYSGPERRTQAQQDYTSALTSTPPGQRTPGEELAEQVRQARAGKPAGISEGDALRQIMRDPDLYEKYKDADKKTRDAMLVKAKNEIQSQGSKSELAGKLQGARSVYKGRR